MAITDRKLKPRPINVVGTEDDDTLDGTSGDDTLEGLGGDDVLNGLGANDLLLGGDDDDVLNGGTGADTLHGGSGNDELHPGTGVGDALFGEEGEDLLNGNGGAQLSGGPGDDLYQVFGGDMVFEAAGEGVDTVLASSSYTLPEGQVIEILQAQVSANTPTLTLTGNGVSNTINGSTHRDILNGAGGNDTIFGMGGFDNLNGNEGNDTLHSDVLASIANGGAGSDTFHVNIWDVVEEAPGEGSDRVLSPTGYHLTAFAEVEILEADDLNSTSSIRFSGNQYDNILRGNAGNNMLSGGGGSDQLTANGGNDILDGGSGSDTLEGGAGVDVFAFTTAIGSNNTDTVADFLPGIDKIALSLQVFTGLALGALPAGAFATGAAAGDADDRIIYNMATGALLFDADGSGAGGAVQFATLQTGLALAASDFVVVNGTQIANGIDAPLNLMGTLLRDVMFGGSGDDTIDGWEGADVLVGGNGNDTLKGGNTGPPTSDTLYGEEGDDVLDGGVGADRMYGGRGNDTYFVDDRSTTSDIANNAGDLAWELQGEGIDTLHTSVEYTLGDDTEIENVVSTTSATVTGNSLDNTMTGQHLRGAGGNDILYGTGLSSLDGGIGNDVIVGSAGVDVMGGGTGNDTFYVDNASDVVNELAGEGNDRVVALISFVLASGVEVELIETATVTATNAINITGNELVNTINGNNGVNILDGGAGNDILSGFGGDDFLVGGTGADAMSGGLGNDNYYVDDAGDTVSETAGEGTDRIATLVSYTLAANASIEILEATNSTSTNAMDLAGNGLDNVVAGNNGANTITGGGGNDTLAGYAGTDTLNGGEGNDTLIAGLGNDTMVGGLGNDKYYVEDAGDVITEAAGQGTDTAASNVSYTLTAGAEVENLEPITFGSTAALDLTGNELANSIAGNNGANTLNGGLGADVLEGLGGQDLFAFTTALGNGNIDRINDFLSSFDRIVLEDSIFTGLTPGGLFANQFVVGAQAADADDRIIYNSATGAILFDVDGTGAMAAVQFATIGTGLNITANDFLVI